MFGKPSFPGAVRNMGWREKPRPPVRDLHAHGHRSGRGRFRMDCGEQVILDVFAHGFQMSGRQNFKRGSVQRFEQALSKTKSKVERIVDANAFGVKHIDPFGTGKEGRFL